MKIVLLFFSFFLVTTGALKGGVKYCQQNVSILYTDMLTTYGGGGGGGRQVGRGRYIKIEKGREVE
jgi:hypothetical protein